MAGDKTFYITTPIYYVNGVPHVGTATTTLLCDALARYHRLRGEPTFFLTGTDEHAQKGRRRRRQSGRAPQAFVDRVSAQFAECWQFLDISYDDFIRTSEPRHKAVVAEVFRRLRAQGDIYAGKYEGWYSVADETFLRDSEVEGRASDGDRRRRRARDGGQLLLPPVGLRRPAAAYIEGDPDFLQPDTRRNEVLAFIKDGLRDIAISRAQYRLGHPRPRRPVAIIYVWFDAVINYLTATGWPDNAELGAPWPADVHLVGKEIYTRFHATLWPAMLMALGLPLPSTVLGHGWWLIEGEKGSKSKGNIPTPQEAVADLVERSGAAHEVAVDALRYYLIRDISFTGDAEFSCRHLIETRYNADLANKLGNLLNRTLNMLAQYPERRRADGAARGRRAAPGDSGARSRQDVERAMLALDPGAALKAIERLVKAANEDIDARPPGNVTKKATRRPSPTRSIRLWKPAHRQRPAGPVPAPHAGVIREQLGLSDVAALGRRSRMGPSARRHEDAGGAADLPAH